MEYFTKQEQVNPPLYHLHNDILSNQNSMCVF